MRELSLQEMQDIGTEMLREVTQICNRHKITYYLVYGSALGAVRHQGPIPWDSDVDIMVPIDQISHFVKMMRLKLSPKFYVDYYDRNLKSVILFPRIGLKGYSTKVLHIDVYKMIGAPTDRKEQQKFKEQLEYCKNNIQFKNLKEGYFAFNKIPRKAKYAIYAKAFLMQFISKNGILKRFEELCNKYPLNGCEVVTNAAGGYGMKEFIEKRIMGSPVRGIYEGIEIPLPEKVIEYLTHFYGDFKKLPPEEARNTGKTYILKEYRIKHD